jgi:hypothetical protein
MAAAVVVIAFGVALTLRFYAHRDESSSSQASTGAKLAHGAGGGQNKPSPQTYKPSGDLPILDPKPRDPIDKPTPNPVPFTPPVTPPSPTPQEKFVPRPVPQDPPPVTPQPKIVPVVPSPQPPQPQYVPRPAPQPVAPPAAPTSGNLHYQGPPVPRGGAVIFDRLPQARLRFFYDRNSWGLTIKPNPDGTKKLILYSLREGLQSKCDVQWQVAN